MARNAGSIDSLLSEINAVFGHAAENGRDELNAEEIEYITKITKRVVDDTQMQLSDIALLMPEEISEEALVLIVKGGAN